MTTQKPSFGFADIRSLTDKAAAVSRRPEPHEAADRDAEARAAALGFVPRNPGTDQPGEDGPTPGRASRRKRTRKTTRLVVTTTPEIANRFAEIANAADISYSDTLSRLLDNYAAEQGA